MRCPFCGTDDTQVKDSRASEDGVLLLDEEDYVPVADLVSQHLKEFN